MAEAIVAGDEQASSPDEEALVQGASLLGFTLSARTHDKVRWHTYTCIRNVASQ